MTIRRVALILILLLLVGAGASGYWGYKELHTRRSHQHASEYIEIPRGASPTQIASKLKDLGILNRDWPFLFYIKWSGAASRLKAGEYRFSTPISPLEVLAKLEVGEERLNKFTVIEGWTRWDIAEAMARIPDLKLSEADALALMNNTSAIANVDPLAQNLEGYLYPDTYSFPLDATPSQMIAAMVKRFHSEWKPEWTDRARALGLTPREVVTIASLIETEAKLPAERPLIASVIYNRLKIRMPLGVDSSIIYASKLAGKWRDDGKVYKSDIERNSPYNIRIHTGLPPGPIASPSSSSLSAALFPATSDFLYYVREPTRDDGAHNFYSNEREFSRGVEALRQWERERDARNAAERSNGK